VIPPGEEFKMSSVQVRQNLLTPSARTGRTAAVAVAAAIGFAGIAVFEIALAAGAPWGHAAWGGAHAHLSAAQRTGSAVAVVVWAAAALIVLGRAGLWSVGRRTRLFRWGTWFLAGVSGIAALMNFASHSHWENLIFGPAALVLAALCILAARSAPAGRQPDAGNAAGDAAGRAGPAAARPGEDKAEQPSAR
jgi:hypothetical protein